MTRARLLSIFFLMSAAAVGGYTLTRPPAYDGAWLAALILTGAAIAAAYFDDHLNNKPEGPTA